MNGVVADFSQAEDAFNLLRENDRIDGVGRGQTAISVLVRQPEVQHKVRVQELKRCLESQGRTPAEVSLKGRLRELLGHEVARAAWETIKNRNR